MWITEYTVSGTAPFPLDMLRWDGSYPARSEDVDKLGKLTKRLTAERPVTRVTLFRRVDRKLNARPNAVRWLSFGWVVDSWRCWRVC